jgi:hypothetical protein
MKDKYDFIALHSKKHPYSPKLYKITDKVLVSETCYYVTQLNDKWVVTIYVIDDLENKIVKFNNILYYLKLEYSNLERLRINSYHTEYFLLKPLIRYSLEPL